MRRRFIIALTFAWGTSAPACLADSPTHPKTVDIGVAVNLRPGQAAAVRDGSLEVRFLEVIEDSRCPRDANCIWAGEVKLRVSVKARGQDAVERELREGETAVFGDREVQVVAVAPVPVSTRKIAAEEYRATFRVTVPEARQP